MSRMQADHCRYIHSSIGWTLSQGLLCLSGNAHLMEHWSGWIVDLGMFSTFLHWILLRAWSSAMVWTALPSTAWFTLLVLSETHWVGSPPVSDLHRWVSSSRGRCITAMGRKYHVEHFICSYCTRQLHSGTFKEYQNKPYCHPCFVKLFAWTVFQISLISRLEWNLRMI